MGRLKPIFESLAEAAVRGARHADTKLPQLARNHGDQLDDWVRRIRDEDHYDGAPGTNTPGDVTPDAPYRPDMSRKPASMSDAEYLRLLDESVHNPDGPEAVLGKYSVEGTPSYVAVAEGRQPPSTYFSLGDDWGTIADAHNLSDGDMFEAFNVPFLDRMMAEGKPIDFSHDPRDFPDSALASEFDYLQDRGYVFDAGSMRAVRP